MTFSLQGTFPCACLRIPERCLVCRGMNSSGLPRILRWKAPSKRQQGTHVLADRLTARGFHLWRFHLNEGRRLLWMVKQGMVLLDLDRNGCLFLDRQTVGEGLVASWVPADSTLGEREKFPEVEPASSGPSRVFKGQNHSVPHVGGVTLSGIIEGAWARPRDRGRY